MNFALDAHRFDFMQKCFAFGSNYSTSLEFIIRQIFLRRTPRLGSVELHHLGEITRRNSRTDFVEKTLSANSYKGNPIALSEGELGDVLEKAS
jgi:hypothetical protein